MVRLGKIMLALLLPAAIAAFFTFPRFFISPRDKGKAAVSARGGAERDGAALYSSLSGLSVINVKDNRTLWVATSKKAILAGDGQTARLSGVAIDIPAEDAKLSASGGELDLDSNVLTLDGEIKSQIKGFDLKTSSVQIVPGGKLNTGKNDPVLLEKKGIEIEGRGLDANQEKKVRLDNDVKAIFY